MYREGRAPIGGLLRSLCPFPAGFYESAEAWKLKCIKKREGKSKVAVDSGSGGG